MIWASIKDILAFLVGRGWLWCFCGVCGHLIWIRKNRVHSVKFRGADSEHVWITLPLCLVCSIDFAKMERDAKRWRENRTE